MTEHIQLQQIPTQLLNVNNYDAGNYTLIECQQPSNYNRLQCSRIVRIAEPLSLYRKPAFTSIDLTETGKVSPLKIIGKSIIVDQIPLQKIHQFSDLLRDSHPLLGIANGRGQQLIHRQFSKSIVQFKPAVHSAGDRDR